MKYRRQRSRFRAVPWMVVAGALALPTASKATSGRTASPINPIIGLSLISFSDSGLSSPVRRVPQATFRVQPTFDSVPHAMAEAISGGSSSSTALTNSQEAGTSKGPPAPRIYPTLPPKQAGNTNRAGNTWTNAIIVDLPPPGTVVNLSGAFLPPGMTNIVAISAGKSHALAIREDSTVVAWGNGVAHELGLTNVPAHLLHTIAICAGDEFSLALQRDGTVTGWGTGACTNVPAGLFGVVAVAAGRRHAVALRYDGPMVAWGSEATLPAGLSGVKAIAAGESHTLAVMRDGTVRAFGAAPLPLTDAPTNAVAVTAHTSFYALTAEKRVVAFGGGSERVPDGLVAVRALSARDGRCLALKEDGTVVGWGNVRVPATLIDVDAVAAGALYCLALTTNPPRPTLSVQLNAGSLQLSAPMAVSGYALQSAEALAVPWRPFDLPAEVLTWEDAERPFVTLPASDRRMFFRLKRTD